MQFTHIFSNLLNIHWMSTNNALNQQHCTHKSGNRTFATAAYLLIHWLNNIHVHNSTKVSLVLLFCCCCSLLFRDEGGEWRWHTHKMNVKWKTAIAIYTLLLALRQLTNRLCTTTDFSSRHFHAPWGIHSEHLFTFSSPSSVTFCLPVLHLAFHLSFIILLHIHLPRWAACTRHT